MLQGVSGVRPICLLGMLVICGCQDPTESDPNINLCDVTEHQWYITIIEAVEDGSILHGASTIFRYSYEGNYYFEVSNPLFSCMYCYIYDCDGNLAEFSNITDFIENRKDRVVIWIGPGVP